MSHSFEALLNARLHRALVIASDNRNIVKLADGASLRGGDENQGGWAPAIGDAFDQPETWQHVDELYPHVRVRSHMGHWETPVDMSVHVEEVLHPVDKCKICMRVFSVQFQLNGHFLPGHVHATEETFQQLLMPIAQQVLFAGYTDVSWSLHVGDPVPVVMQGPASAGNVTFRTPVLCRMTADHDDPRGARLLRSLPEGIEPAPEVPIG